MCSASQCRLLFPLGVQPHTQLGGFNGEKKMQVAPGPLCRDVGGGPRPAPLRTNHSGVAGAAARAVPSQGSCVTFYILICSVIWFSPLYSYFLFPLCPSSALPGVPAGSGRLLGLVPGMLVSPPTLGCRVLVPPWCWGVGCSSPPSVAGPQDAGDPLTLGCRMLGCGVLVPPQVLGCRMVVPPCPVLFRGMLVPSPSVGAGDVGPSQVLGRGMLVPPSTGVQGAGRWDAGLPSTGLTGVQVVGPPPSGAGPRDAGPPPPALARAAHVCYGRFGSRPVLGGRPALWVQYVQ